MSDKLDEILAYHESLDDARMQARVTQAIRRYERRQWIRRLLMTGVLGCAVALAGMILIPSIATAVHSFADWLITMDFSEPAVWGSAGTLLLLIGWLAESEWID